MYGDGSEEVQRALHWLDLATNTQIAEYVVMQDAYDNDNACFVRTPDSVVSDCQREIRALPFEIE
jgi:hypothetical protein